VHSGVHDIRKTATASRSSRNSTLFSGLPLPPRQCSPFQSFRVDRGIFSGEHSPSVRPDLGYIGVVVRGDSENGQEGSMVFLPPTLRLERIGTAIIQNRVTPFHSPKPLALTGIHVGDRNELIIASFPFERACRRVVILHLFRQSTVPPLTLHNSRLFL
jgi:hypothetical protein